MESMALTYETCVEPYVPGFLKITVPFKTIQKIYKFVNAVIKEKKKEIHHKIDCQKEWERFYTGCLGEAAVEIALGIPFTDYTVGDSKQFNLPDVLSKNLGVKTVEFGKFPVIFKKNDYGQIITIKISESEVLIAGIATKEILNQYQSEELILDQNLRKRGTKTGFYGFSHLIPIQRKERNIGNMKPILLDQNNIGVLVGHLCSPDELQVDNGGTVEKYKLTGNVVDTKSYDVLAIGKKIGDDVFQVEKMESVADQENPYDIYDVHVEDSHLEVLSFHKSLVRKHDKAVVNDKTITNIEIDTGNGLMHARTFREDYRVPETGGGIILIGNKNKPSGITTEVKEYGTGYAKKKVTAYYCSGLQLLS